MSQLKFSQEDKTKVKDKETTIKELDKREMSYICQLNKHIQACAWILLTIGLCIIVTTFYLSFAQQSYSANSLVVDGRSNADDNNANIEQIVHDQKFGGTHSGEWKEMNNNGRGIVMDGILDNIANNLNGCRETLCQIACTNAENVYLSLYSTMQKSACATIDIVILDRQNFPLRVLKNNWLPFSLSIHEVIIRSSFIAKIQSDAFNAPIFAKTLLMSWSQLNINKVESGALLGLYKLKYLSIVSHMNVLEPSFFQPVQSTLTHLKLNANLQLEGNQNFFGVSNMKKLEYLDLSFNQFKGSLAKKFFKSTPNLNYLIIVEAHLSHIDANTFEHLSNKLLFVNLSKNQLTTLTSEVMGPILRMQKTALISLSGNDWKCDCELKDLGELYRNFRMQFMDAAYCKAPHNLYGVTIDEVDFENCKVPSKTTTPINYDKTAKGSGTDSYSLDSGETKSAESSTIFKMRCFNSESSSTSSSSLSSPSSKSSELKIIRRNSDGVATNDLGFLQFPAPEHEFELNLISDNNTVIVSVEAASTIVIIWFSEQTYDEASVSTEPFDYTCMKYKGPSLLVGPLQENTTYTFCLIPSLANEISPLNCLPLHVPGKKQENIWISEDKKQFTIGMLCLIFLLSTIAGALIAYFGIKSYPDLLEGSKNVLIVKKPDQACYVSTISETEYQKQSSVKKKKGSIRDIPSLKKQTSIKLPPSPETPPPPFHMSVMNLERLSSSTSTCFEDTFPDYAFQDGNYETPKVCGNEYTTDQRCVPNKYGMSPGSPPPLPKRNSNIAESPTMVINRFSSKFD